MTTSAWSVVAVDAATGASPATLPGVAIRPLRQALNEPDSVELELLTTNPALAEFLDPTREIQIVRDGTVMFWGPSVRVEIDDDTARIQCADPRWYLGRRYFGEAGRHNFLDNGDFEAGAADWTGEGLGPVVDPTRFVEGTRSVRLTGTAAGHDTYLHQTYTHTQAHPAGDQLTISAWVWVSSADYLGDATGSLGLFAERRGGEGELLDVAGDAGDDQPCLINAALPKDQWHRFETTLDFVKTGDTIDVRLYPPFGTAWWDLVTLTEQESLSFVGADLAGADLATVIRGVVAYAQGAYFSHGKSDLNIAVEAAPTGITLFKTWQFADHQNIGDELDAFTSMRGGVDYTMGYTDTTRTLIVGYPHVGTVRDDISLTTGLAGNVTGFRWSHDRTQQADSSVVLGPGDGPDREEGGATATSAGPTLEDVTVAPDGTLPDALGRLAAERLAVVTHPEVLEVTGTGLIGVLGLGDWVQVAIHPDDVDIYDLYRAVALTTDPANDTTLVTLNLRDPITAEEAMARFPRAVDACTDSAGGVWVVGSDGGVGAYNGATFHGSLPDDAIIPNAPVVAIVPHGAGGYWLVGADTGIFAYGDAPVRYPYAAMVATEYAQGDRAIIGAEPYDSGGDDNLIMLADDGAYYIGALTP